jgi:hypothetical protein
MRQGKGNGYFCASKMPDGSWCSQKAAGEVAAAPAGLPAAMGQSNGNNATPKLLLILGALDFAAKVYQGTGQADDAVMLANQTFAGWKDEA